MWGEKPTSHDNATVVSGSVDNEVLFTYNDFGQLTADYQEHGGAVNTSTSPKVGYGYDNRWNNTIRPTTLTYPDGHVVTSDYGPPGETNDALSRVGAIVDDGSTHLADYSYLGQNTPVEVDYTEPDLKYTLIGTAGGNDPDTGDQYLGLDRFGRVKDSMWYDYSSSADADRVKYGYDRSGNRTWRDNTVGSDYDETYQYDQIDRLQRMDRGILDSETHELVGIDFIQAWGLDATGNWKRFCEDDLMGMPWDLDQTRTSNPVNEITDITETTGPAWLTPTYNRAGNMTTIPKPSDPTTGYTATYDAWNRLVKLVDGANTVCEYRYDAAKRRIVQKSYTGGSLDETRHFYYTDPKKWQVIEERVDASTDPDRQFVWGLRYIDDVILRDRDTSDPKNGTLDERLYTLQDANWNVTSIAATDGTIQERYAYDPYGRPIFLTPTFASRASSNYDCETLYAGYRYDSHTGMYHVRNRILHALFGWLQRDALRYVDGLSLYQYVFGRSTVKLDPFGQAMIGGDPVKSCIMECENTCYELYGDWFWPWEYATYVGCVAGCPSGCHDQDFTLCNYVNNWDECYKLGLQCACGGAALLDLWPKTPPGWNQLFGGLDCACALVTALQSYCSGGEAVGEALLSVAVADCGVDLLESIYGDLPNWLDFSWEVWVEGMSELELFLLGGPTMPEACWDFRCRCV